MMDVRAANWTSAGVKMAKTHQQSIIFSVEPGEDWSWCFIDEIEVFPT
jgi:hypothetical protein